MTVIDQSDLSAFSSQFAALVAAATAGDLADFKVFAMIEQADWASLFAGGREAVLFDDLECMFAALVDADEPTLVLPPWGRRPSSGRLTVARPPRRRFGVIVPRGDLKRELSRLYPHEGAPRLVVDARAGLPGIHHSFRAALVIIDPTGARPSTTRFFKAPEQIDVPVHELVRDLNRLLVQDGGVTKYGYVYRGSSLTGQSLLHEEHDPAVAASVAELAAFGEGALVRDIFDVRRARPAELGPALPTDVLGRVICGRDVSRAGEILAADADPEVSTRWLPVPLLAGDLVLREIEAAGQPSMPAEVQSADLPVAAGRGLIVLRPKAPLDPEEHSFYKLFLGTQRARDVMRPSTFGGAIRLSFNADTPMPRPDADLLSALRDIRQAQVTMQQWVNESSELINAAFTGSAAQARRRLIETGRELRQRAEAASQVGSLDHRIANFYPYPVAYKWRNARVRDGGEDHAATYRALLDCFEATMAYGAALGLTFAHVNQIDVPAMGEVRRKLAGARGTSIGDWVNILKNVSSGKTFKAADPDSPLAAIRGFLPEGSDVARAQERLSRRRNDESHQRAVEPLDLPSAIAAAQVDLECILENAAFLADLTLFQVNSVRWDSLTRQGRAVAHALRGDHPVAASVELELDHPNIETGSLYIKDASGTLVLLRPFLIRQQCPQCRTWSTFYPDRREEGRLLLKALDHSHTVGGQDHEAALRSVNYID